MNDSKFNAKAKFGEEIIEIHGDRPVSFEFVPDTGLSSQFRRMGSAFCPKCEKPIQLLSFERSAELFKTDAQDIQFLGNRGDLHRVHNRMGELMVCSDSLFDCFDSRDTRLLDSHFEIEMQKSFEAKIS